ncbi:hypothetical protein RI129_001785 [Pyrocoelia pectoralis]|uniref:MMS19 nucleotide excision repair protein n=1 Tax=Pyrocoelia pectoralis TaxID=417401 RepID=A0AAN7VUN0_9COLE
MQIKNMDNINNSLVEQFHNLNKDDAEFLKKCLKLVEDINQGSSTFLQLIEQLKGLLIDPVPTNREYGMQILTQVLEEISHNQITPTQLHFVSDFYAERLKDHHQVVPVALRGTLALMSFNNLPEEQVRNLLQSIFQNIPCQQQQQHDRLNIYKIFQISLENRLRELQAMGFDYIYGVITALDGERDPRNLLFLFNWLPKFLKRFTLGHLSEEMFEVLACYFPVDFRTPPQDPNSINRQTLASSLSACLCATSEFAEYCLPLALEKLSSSLSIAKFDSLDIIGKGCDIFPLSFYVQHSTDIWSQIQREVLNNGDEELEKVALDTFVIVMNKLSQNPDNVYKPILSDIVDTLKGNLVPNTKLFIPSCKMLHHLCKSSKTAATFVIAEIVPLMVNTFHITLTPSHQILILNNLVHFVRIYTDIYENADISGNLPLSQVTCLCLKASLENDLDLRAGGLHCTSIITNSLPSDIRKCFYENMCSLLISEQPDLVRFPLLKTFKSLAESHGDEVQMYVLNQISINNNGELYRYLRSLSTIVEMEKFTEDILATFFKYCQANFDVALIGIDCLRQLLEEYAGNTRIQCYLGETLQLVPNLLDFVLNYLNIIDYPNHKQLLGDISTISKIILRHQSGETQIGLASKCDKVISSYRSGQNVGLVIVMDGLVSCLRRDVKLQLYIVPDLLDVAMKCPYDFIATIACQLLANILNKNLDEEQLENDLKWLEECLNKHLENDKLGKAIHISSWITKALLMRGHVKGAVWTEKLIRLLDDHEEAAKGFEIIMKNCPALSEESFCNVKFLYRQKFFMEITTLLTQNYKESNKNYLLAIGYILKEAPRQVFIMQFKKIVKIVLLCLEKCQNGEILLVVLERLYDLIQSKEAVTEEYLQELLASFIALSTFRSSMNVRIKALECIQHFAVGYPMYKLLPLKQDVIRNLALCLDDKKRLVRKGAVEARLSWIMLDALT